MLSASRESWTYLLSLVSLSGPSQLKWVILFYFLPYPESHVREKGVYFYRWKYWRPPLFPFWSNHFKLCEVSQMYYATLQPRTFITIHSPFEVFLPAGPLAPISTNLTNSSLHFHIHSISPRKHFLSLLWPQWGYIWLPFFIRMLHNTLSRH